LSGNADIQGLRGAINETHIYRFVAKPWEEAELKSAITQALNYRRILEENRRLADSYRGGSLTPGSNRAERRHSYRIAVVNGEAAVLDLIRNGLAGTDHKVETDSLWREISHDYPAASGMIEFRIDTFASGQQALDQTQLANYDLVIAAPTLPDMSGVQFLRRWMQGQPGCARILMGSLPDVRLLAQAINEVQVYCFLDFPWESYEMKADVVRRRIWHIHRLQSSVMEALAARELVSENERLADAIREYR